MKRRRARGGATQKAPPHGAHHMLLIIGVAPKKKPRRAGGHVEGAAARHHLGKRARGGRASGGDTDKAPPVPLHGGEESDWIQRNAKGKSEPPLYPRDEERHSGGRTKRAHGGPADAAERAKDPNGVDHVPHGESTGEREVPMELRRGGRASGGDTDCDDRDERARGGAAFRTPSGSVSAGARREAESHGDAMPGGRFPIRNASDLSNAKHAFGRANDKLAVRRWINKRAKELGKPPMGGDE